MHDSTDRPAASVRGAELFVAVVIFILGAISIKDGLRLGHGWSPSIGPQSGYFPYYIGGIICLSAITIFIQALRAKALASEVFVTRGQLKLVLKVLIPTAIYAVLISYLGFYVASMIYIAFFMWWIGSYGVLKIAPIAIGVPVFFYFMFEKWFAVPLPKGPIENMLGIG